MLLCVLSAPTLAATGIEVACDQGVEHVDVHAIDDLAIETVDHGITKTITTEDDLSGGGEEDAELLPIAAREAEILRRIFDETVTDATEEIEAVFDEDDPVDSSIFEDRSAEVAETEDADQDSSDTLLPGVQLPETTAEEMLRYRRQMFRTDI